MKDLKRLFRKISISPPVKSPCRRSILGKSDSLRKITEDFDKIRMDNWLVHIRKDFPKHEIRNLISAIDPSAQGQTQFTKVPSSNYTHVFRYNVSFNGGVDILYVKRHLRRSVWDLVKHIFRPSRAKRAFKASLMLKRDGFDIPTVIGLFERRLGPFHADDLLLTREVKGSKPLCKYISQFCNCATKEELREKRQLISSFGQTIGRLHAKAIFHGDMRLGNVLVQKERNMWRFSFLDNERTARFWRLPDRLRLKNLVQLNMARSDAITNTDRIRFLREYWAQNEESKKERRVLIQKVVRKTRLRLSKKKEVRKALKNCLRTNKRYLRVKAGQYRGVFDRGFCQGGEPLDFIEQIDTLMDKGAILKNGNTSSVSCLTWNGEDVVVKRYNHRGLIHSLRHTMKRSRARRNWLHAHRLAVLNIAAPRPLAYIEQRRGPIVWKSYFVSDYVRGQKLKDFLRDSRTGEEEPLTVTGEVKDLLDKLGKYKITHGDLKHTNILITETGPVLTDLDGMKVHRWNWTCKVRYLKDLKRFGEIRDVIYTDKFFSKKEQEN